MADAEDSKSSVGNHMRVQVPPSAPKISPTVFGYLAQKTLAVKSSAQRSRLTLAELWLFSEFASTRCRIDLRGRSDRGVSSGGIHRTELT